MWEVAQTWDVSAVMQLDATQTLLENHEFNYKLIIWIQMWNTQNWGSFWTGQIHHTHTYGGGAGQQVFGGSNGLQKMDASQERVMERRMTDGFPRVQSQQSRPGTIKRSPHRLHLA